MELNIYDNQLHDDLEILSLMVEEIKGDSLNGVKLKNAQIKINDILETKKHYGMELRQVKEKARKVSYEVKLKSYDERLREMIDVIDAMDRRRQRTELLNTRDGAKSIFNYDSKGKDNQELLNATSDVQDHMELALDRTEATMEDTHKIGLETIEQLQKQQEQMKNINSELDNMETSLQRANRLITEFTQRMMTDRVIQGFFLINTVLLTVVIVLLLQKEGKI